MQEIRFSLRALLAIVGCELRLQVRSLTLWLLLLLCCGTTALLCWYQKSDAGIGHQGGMLAASSLPLVENFVLLLLPFLFFNAFARDKRRKIYGILWTRPLGSPDYVLGKALAAIVISLLLTMLLLISGWVTLSIGWHTWLSIQPWLAWFPLLAASNVLVALLTLLCISLVPLPLLAVLITSGIMSYFVLLRMNNMLRFPNFSAASIFYAPSVGFGPDAPLVWGQCLCLLCLVLLCLGLGILAYQVRERIGLSSRRHTLSAVLLVVLASALFIPSLNNFRTLAAGYDDLGPPPGQPMAARTDHYRLAISANPESGYLEGSASFVVTPAARGVNTLSIALSPGLHVQQVLTGQTSLSFQTSYGWTHIDLSQPGAAKGKPVSLSITYSGLLTTNRIYYADSAAGILEPVSHEHGFSNPLLSYLGQGLGAFQGQAGYWYPLPWTTQAVQEDVLRPVIDEARFRIPSSAQIVSSLPLSRTNEGQWQEVQLQSRSRFPMALLAALSSPQQVHAGSASIYSTGQSPNPDNLRFDQAMARQVDAIQRWLQPSAHIAHWNVVITPLITNPLLGPGLLFVPEQLYGLIVDAARSTIRTVGPFVASELVAKAWWQNVEQLPLDISSEPKNLASLQKHDTTYISTGAYWSADMFANYSATFVTDQVVAPGFLAQKQSLCQGRLHGWPEQKRQAAEALGIYEMYCDFTFLDYLERHDGAAKVTHLLQQLAQPGEQHPMNLKEFLASASVVIVRDVTKEAQPYICSKLSSVPIAYYPMCMME